MLISILSVLQEYGDIEYCVIIKNKFTGESKGLGYVRYYKPSQAALAIENCDKGRSAKLIYLFINPGRSSCMNIKYTELG